MDAETLHDALVADPRGCEHPKSMRPQCERLALALVSPAPNSDQTDRMVEALHLAVAFIDKVQEYGRVNRIDGVPGPMERAAAVLATTLRATLEPAPEPAP